MSQNALTVTAANPTPPTNLSFVGNTAPLDPAQAVVDDGLPKPLPDATTAGSNLSTPNEAAGTTYAQASLITFPTSTAAANTGGAPGAGISNTHEARGAETSATAASANPSALGQNKAVGVGPALTAGTMPTPNASHASSLSPTANLTPTTSAASGASNVSGVGTTLLTVTGTNFNRTSTVNLNGVRQPTNYVSATSLTVTNALKRTTAGTLPVTVTNDNSGITSNSSNWTLT